MKGDLRFVVPALAGSSFIPPKGGTTNVSRRSMQYPGEALSNKSEVLCVLAASEGFEPQEGA